MARVKDKGIFENFFRRDGRLNRWRYFKRNIAVALLSIMILLVIIILDVNAFGHLSSFGNNVVKLFSAAAQIPLFCLMVRRLHDMNKTETLAYVAIGLGLVPIIFRDGDFLVTEPSNLENLFNTVSGFISLYIMLCPGTHGDNQYGADPLE